MQAPLASLNMAMRVVVRFSRLRMIAALAITQVSSPLGVLLCATDGACLASVAHCAPLSKFD